MMLPYHRNAIMHKTYLGSLSRILYLPLKLLRLELEKCEAGISSFDSWHLYRLTPSVAAVQVLLIYNL